MALKRKRGLCWLFAFLLTAALFAVIALFLDLRYAGNDDSGLVRAFLGYETGTPASFHLYVHGLLTWPLYFISCAFPGIAWVSWLQLALLFLSCLVCSKGIMQCFVKHEKPLWLGAIAAACFVAVFMLSGCTHITYTQTAAMLGAAAVCQIISIDYENATPRGVVWRMMGALALVVLCYALRQIVALPVFVFCGIAFAVEYMAHYGFGKQAKKSPKPMVVSLALIAAVMAVLMGARAIEIRANNAEDYLAWDKARTAVMDYEDLSELPPEVLNEIGWSENMAEWVGTYWFLMDKSVTTEAFETILAYEQSRPDRGIAQRLNTVAQTTGELWSTSTDARLALVVALGCFVLSIVLATSFKRRHCLWGLIGATVALLAMLIYLAWRGRLPYRALITALAPFAAFVFSLLPACLPRTQGHRAVCFLTALALVLGGTAYVAANLPDFLPTQVAEGEEINPIADMYEYALYEPDMLFIHDLNLIDELRLFPDMSEGVPHNISAWGGWSLRSNASIAQFANWDIDILNFSAEDFLRDDICLVTTVVDPPPALIVNYLREKADPTVEGELYGEYGYIYCFQFYIP